jgi:hypothetical protein
VSSTFSAGVTSRDKWDVAPGSFFSGQIGQSEAKVRMVAANEATIARISI